MNSDGTSVMVMATVAVLEVAVPSEVVKLKESEPKKPGSGV